MIDQRTATRDYLKPHTDNTLDEDVARIRSTFDAIDADVNARLVSASYTASDILVKLLTVDGPTSGISVQYLGGHDSDYFAASSTVAAHLGAGAGAHALVTSASSGFMSPALLAKLDGIQPGADVSPVRSVAGKTGDITLSATDASAAPIAHVGASGTAHAAVTTASAGFMAATDKIAFNQLAARAKAGRLYFLRG